MPFFQFVSVFLM